MNRLQALTLLLLCFFAQGAQAQVTGGQFAMEYLRLPNAPRISALGGISIANPDDDISFAMQNPALIRPALHTDLGLSYNNFYSGISIANLQYAHHVSNINTSFALGVQYLNYGSFTATDPIGNQYGTFRANDFALTLGAGRQYQKHWRYGAAIKFAHSSLFDKSATAFLADVGVNYYDTATLWDIGVVAKNMGFMAKKYNPNNPAEPLPFDLQIGVSKRFAHIPLRLMANIHHLYEWDVRYSDPNDVGTITIFNVNDSVNATKTPSHFADKLFRHFIFGAELTLGKRVTLSAGYNHLRRGELVIKDKTGMAGFAFGVGVNLNKFQVQYARSYYHIAGAYNEFGLRMTLNQITGIGKFGKRVQWSETYPDWMYEGNQPAPAAN
ncbi:type IX secretion system protein PorQ [Polluticoccus soli]|uniref:type IX secretion system protein PorQ n=1 Tax=Polluticoccus soli TaxID=3034150 RepID=UPI0023E30840|nr:type IX secretion system protein PorQ [Flavipsychrobacter sp. JY13-12]